MEQQLLYVLEMNNGESYEDNDHWVYGIFTTFEEAFKNGCENAPEKSFNFSIDEYIINTNKSIHNIYVEKNQNGQWTYYKPQ